MSIDTKELREQARLARQLRAHTGGQLAIDADQLDQLLDAADRLAALEAENERLNARLNAAQLTTYEMTLESCVEQCEKDPAALEHLRPTLQRLANALEGGDERKVEADASLTEAAPELLKALQAAIDCGMVPQSTAEDGAVRHSRHVQVADMIRAAITKATGGAQ